MTNGNVKRILGPGLLGLLLGCAAEPASVAETPDLTGFGGPTGTTIEDSQQPAAAPTPTPAANPQPAGTPPVAAPPAGPPTPPAGEPPAPPAGTPTPPVGEPPAPPTGTPTLPEPTPPMAGGGAEPIDSGTPPGTLAVEVTTDTYGGRYARDGNYGAIWIEKSDNTFVKTVIRWAGATHAGDLTQWTAASGGWGFFGFGGNAADQMDVISMATLRSHQSHMVTWNLKDASGSVVADGEYLVAIELSEGGTTKVARVPFTKGEEPLIIEHPDQPNLTGIVVRYQP